MNTDNQPVNTMSTKPPENRGAGGAPRGNKNAIRHGHYARETALKAGRLDRRTKVSKAVEARIREWSKALGASLSPQKGALLREAAEIEAVLAQPLTAHLATVRIVRRGKVDPAVELRLRLSSQLRDLLTAVGLDKVKRQPRPLWR